MIRACFRGNACGTSASASRASAKKAMCHARARGASPPDASAATRSGCSGRYVRAVPGACVWPTGGEIGSARACGDVLGVPAGRGTVARATTVCRAGPRDDSLRRTNARDDGPSVATTSSPPVSPSGFTSTSACSSVRVGALAAAEPGAGGATCGAEGGGCGWATGDVGTGRLAATGGAGCGSAGRGAGAGAGCGSAGRAAGIGAGTTAGSGAGGGAGWSVVLRAGRNASGSRYPSSSSPRRTPRWTCGSRVTASALSPTAPTRSPSATCAPRAIETAPSCTSVTASPSAVRIVTARPPFGTEPTKLTLPSTGARTAAPTGAPTSIPRCWPPAYGSEPYANGRTTGPSTGQLHAAAGAGAATAVSEQMTSSRRRSAS